METSWRFCATTAGTSSDPGYTETSPRDCWRSRRLARSAGAESDRRSHTRPVPRHGAGRDAPRSAQLALPAGPLRAYYDGYVQARLQHETATEDRALARLRSATPGNSRAAITEAMRILGEPQTVDGAGAQWRVRIYTLAEALFQSIGQQRRGALPSPVGKSRRNPGHAGNSVERCGVAAAAAEGSGGRRQRAGAPRSDRATRRLDGRRSRRVLDDPGGPCETTAPRTRAAIRAIRSGSTRRRPGSAIAPTGDCPG